MKYEGKDRYQFQPWYVKAYRWLRYKPGGWLYVLRISAIWLSHGLSMSAEMRMYFKTRRNYIAHVLMVGDSRAAMNMGHYWTHQEVIAELRK